MTHNNELPPVKESSLAGLRAKAEAALEVDDRRFAVRKEEIDYRNATPPSVVIGLVDENAAMRSALRRLVTLALEFDSRRRQAMTTGTDYSFERADCWHDAARNVWMILSDSAICNVLGVNRIQELEDQLSTGGNAS